MTTASSVLIVGAGFGGVAAAKELLEHGFDVTLIEAASAIGGTWHHNTYPGAACDVPSHFYSFSYAQRADWSRFCSPQAEILDYLQGTAEAFHIADRVVLDTTVTSCRWNDASATWTVDADGPGGPTSYTADAVVIATGQLNQPAYPPIGGRDDFAGRAFHSARWDHAYDLRGKRVAVVGTGASAVQFVPEIASEVVSLTVFQRTGNWFLPREHKDYSSTVHTLFRRVPPLHRLFRLSLFLYMEFLTAMIRHPTALGWIGRLASALFMRGQLTDPAVRRKAWPDYRFGCKRVLFSSAFLPALQRDNVELVTDAITGMTPAGPRTRDGRVHEVDCIIYGTGFRTTEFMFPMQVIGRGGRELRSEWDAGATAHLGISVSGFPSLFLMYGPNTNTSGGSIIFFLECQAAYLRQALELARDRGAAVDVRAEVQHAGDVETQRRFHGTAWLQCNSWYRNEAGRIVTNWPGYMRDYAARTRTLDATDYDLVHPVRQDVPVS
ncbi:flavin-containing monooxygenase [uncultured Jatrophihabitans sp.]|uniref:flavin-containing monooxygenase n=1 Tax=uncultured Jatrophihabitans sp. TaxID=1610747 RepID=UPI0035CB143B